jgi:hypothetical protein
MFTAVHEKSSAINTLILKIWKTVFRHDNGLVSFRRGVYDQLGVTVLSQPPYSAHLAPVESLHERT